VAAVTAVTAAAIGIGAVALIPLAADIVAGTAVAAGREGDASAASARWLAASRLAPWERRYPAGHSAWLAERGAFGQALASQRTATRRAPRNRATAVDLARLTRTVRGPQAAVPVYDTVLDIDSRTPVLLAEAGANALAADRPGRAIGLLRRAVESSSPQPSWSARLRQAEAEAQAAAVPAR
jgi:predicted Zn-dependent protease